MYSSKVITITKVCVNIMFYLGIPVCLLVPAATYFYGYRGFEYFVQTAAVLFSGVASLFIMYQLKRMFKTVSNLNPFVRDNVESLKNIGIASWCIGVIYIAKAIFLPTISTVMIIIIFMCGGLFCFTLMHLFGTAIEFKEENDLMI